MELLADFTQIELENDNDNAVIVYAIILRSAYILSRTELEEKISVNKTSFVQLTLLQSVRRSVY